MKTAFLKFLSLSLIVMFFILLSASFVLAERLWDDTGVIVEQFNHPRFTSEGGPFIHNNGTFSFLLMNQHEYPWLEDGNYLRIIYDENGNLVDSVRIANVPFNAIHNSWANSEDGGIYLSFRSFDTDKHTLLRYNPDNTFRWSFESQYTFDSSWCPSSVMLFYDGIVAYVHAIDNAQIIVEWIDDATGSQISEAIIPMIFGNYVSLKLDDNNDLIVPGIAITDTSEILQKVSLEFGDVEYQVSVVSDRPADTHRVIYVNGLLSWYYYDLTDNSYHIVVFDNEGNDIDEITIDGHVEHHFLGSEGDIWCYIGEDIVQYHIDQNGISQDWRYYNSTLSHPDVIAQGPDGDVLVTDWDHTMGRIDSNGNLLWTAGSASSGDHRSSNVCWNENNIHMYKNGVAEIDENNGQITNLNTLPHFYDDGYIDLSILPKSPQVNNIIQNDSKWLIWENRNYNDRSNIFRERYFVSLDDEDMINPESADELDYTYTLEALADIEGCLWLPGSEIRRFNSDGSLLWSSNYRTNDMDSFYHRTFFLDNINLENNYAVYFYAKSSLREGRIAMRKIDRNGQVDADEIILNTWDYFRENRDEVLFPVFALSGDNLACSYMKHHSNFDYYNAIVNLENGEVRRFDVGSNNVTLHQGIRSDTLYQLVFDSEVVNNFDIYGNLKFRKRSLDDLGNAIESEISNDYKIDMLSPRSRESLIFRSDVLFYEDYFIMIYTTQRDEAILGKYNYNGELIGHAVSVYGTSNEKVHELIALNDDFFWVVSEGCVRPYDTNLEALEEFTQFTTTQNMSYKNLESNAQSNGDLFVKWECGEALLVQKFASPMVLGTNSTDNPLPQLYKIAALQPNPFNSYAKLSIELPQISSLKVNLYNVLGKQVLSVVDGEYKAGRHDFSVNAENLASGIYFLRASVPGKMNEVCKLVLIR